MTDRVTFYLAERARLMAGDLNDNQLAYLTGLLREMTSDERVLVQATMRIAAEAYAKMKKQR